MQHPAIPAQGRREHFVVDNAIARVHPLHASRRDGAVVSQAVKMGHGTFHDIGEGHDTRMGMGKAAVRLR